MKSRIEAIQKLLPPNHSKKDAKVSVEWLTTLAYSAKIYKRLSSQSMNSLEKKCHFIGQNSIRKLLSKLRNCSSKPPVLHLPRPGGRFILYCDTSKTHTGSSLRQMQDGKPRLLGYASKSLPDACKNYSITELEMTGLAINIHLWKHLLLRVEFDCAVDHRALPYIMKSKNLISPQVELLDCLNT